MIRRILTFNGPDRVSLATEEYRPPEGRPIIRTDFSMVSPGTELFCIRQGGTVQPGYIRTGHDAQGRYYFIFPSMAESSAAHCDLHAPGPGSLLLPLPEGFPLELAGFLRFINIGMHPFNRLPVPPERVAVIGLGPVGNLAAQTARLLGCATVGVDSSAKRRELAARCGIEQTAEPETFDMMEREFDLVIDTVSASSTLESAARSLKDGGSCSMVGIVKDGPLAAARLCREIWNRDLHFQSGWEMKNPLSLTERNLKRGLRRMLAKEYVLRPLLTAILPHEPEEIRAAYRKLADCPDDFFCCAIDWR
ncbi:zinc-binding dehydrogenase [Victivallis vadensis]|uniref:zinc-binding dehydrogenase n=1 Tax=Victivallis vadensis TaxID=172901 RepID=UPI00266BC086|nr:zinc-binding dehydrogenase [Victivallis vadensis]